MSAAYGPYRALFDVSFTVTHGGAVALLGSNGAGKSTVARVVTGLLAVTQGTLRIDGADVTGLPAYRIARRGVAHVPEGRGVFANLTVEENLVLVFRQRAGRDRVADSLARAYDAFPVLGERRRQRAGTLSGGQQRLLSLSKVLVVPPKLLGGRRALPRPRPGRCRSRLRGSPPDPPGRDGGAGGRTADRPRSRPSPPGRGARPRRGAIRRSVVRGPRGGRAPPRGPGRARGHGPARGGATRPVGVDPPRGGDPPSVPLGRRRPVQVRRVDRPGQHRQPGRPSRNARDAPASRSPSPGAAGHLGRPRVNRPTRAGCSSARDPSGSVTGRSAGLRTRSRSVQDHGHPCAGRDQPGAAPPVPRMDVAPRSRARSVRPRA